ncbi:MAG: hypothetical protein HY471_00055, partial [Candidatus Sungbacteria bacterium]|nr:hypothetical protein [Candidatus Sungbacteria bacterium]
MANKTIDLRKIKHELRGKGRDESRRHARKSESAPHGGRFSRYHYNKAPGATPAVKELPDSEYQTSDKEPEDNKSPKDRGIETGRQSSAKQEFDHEGAESHSVALFHWEAMEFEHSVEKNLNLFLLGIILIITSVVTIFF